jgi:hypothetical protein
MSLTVSDRRKLLAICERLASTFDGERVAAAQLACQFLASRGLTWSDVLHAEPPAPVVVRSTRTWRESAEEILYNHTGALSEWEQTFLQSVLSDGRAPTTKQAHVLSRLTEKTGVAGW